MYQDIESNQKMLLHFIEKGEDVVLVAHSYGGISASGAAYVLSELSRLKADKKGGVSGPSW